MKRLLFKINGKTIKYILPLVFVLLSQMLYCQDTKIYFDNFTSDNGLSNSYINKILQDRNGWIWIGTGMGINRFDGMKFKNYGISINDSIQKEDISVRNFYESKQGVLYACIEDFGLVKYNREKDLFDRLIINGKTVLTNVSVKDVTEDKDGNLWVASKQGIWKIDFKNQKTVSFANEEGNDNSLISNYVRTLVFDNRSNLWIGTKGGLEKFDPRTKTFIHFAKINSLLDDDILDICIDNKERIWCGTSINGVILLNNDVISRFELDESNERSAKVNTIFQDNEQNFWIGTRGGLFCYNEKANTKQLFISNLLENNSLVHNSVMDVFQDVKGDIWVGTRNGLSYMVKEKQNFVHYKALPNNNKYLNNSEIYCIWLDQSGNIWTGTENGGVNILDKEKGTFSYLTESNNKLNNNCVKSINSTNDGKVLIGTFQGGLTIYDLKTHKTICYKHDNNEKNTISNNIVWDICIDKNKTIWLGTASGLDRFDPLTQTFIHYPQFDDMTNGVTWIGIDNDNDLWLGSEIIRVFRPGVGIISTFKEKGRGLYTDSNGNNWVTTGDRGVVLYDKYKGALKVYDENAGLPCNLSYCILEDNKHNLWISTDNGLACFNPKTERFKNYYKADGLQGNQFNYGASFKSKNGDLIFGGKNGFNIFNPNKIMENTYIPPVYVTDFKIFNQSVKIGPNKKSITETDQIEIPYKYNVITFEFAALNYANSSKNKYKYILEGFDNTWTETAETRSATYTNLNPGTYSFRVIASNDNNLWNNEGTTKEIIVLPPFYKTKWFLGLMMGLVIILFSLVLIFIFRRWESKKTYEFEKREAQRVHELDDFKLQFFTNISHEIKTPLTLIISPIEKILHYEMSKGEINENLNLIYRNAKHLMALITQLLDYRKLEAGKLIIDYKKGDIVRFCRETFLAFEPLMKEAQLNYKFKSVQNEIITLFDPDKLKKIIDNLVSNAIKYNHPNGTVSMLLSLVINNNINSNNSDEFIQIVVQDTGNGIAEKNIEHIFTRFYTGNNKASGSSGIGLAFTKELVKLNNGHINIESKLGSGSSFTVLLPLQNEEKNNEIVSYESDNTLFIDEQEPDTNDDLKNKKILLLVEDNKDVRQFLHSHFKKEFIVYEAENGKKGLELAIKFIPDIIISDVMMPEMDGNELCEKIKKDERTSHIPIIHLSALSSKKNILKGLSKGADDYITKPFDISILQSKVDNLLIMRKSLREKYSKEMVLTPTRVTITSPDELFLQKAIKIVETHIEDPELDIVKFVNQMGISRMQLYRKMSALTNMTVKEFINDIRLKRAYQLLSDSKLNVSEVAVAVGFNDVSYFGKCIRKKFGKTASQIMQRQ